jgi:hypothetical protein
MPGEDVDLGFEGSGSGALAFSDGEPGSNAAAGFALTGEAGDALDEDLAFSVDAGGNGIDGEVGALPAGDEGLPTGGRVTGAIIGGRRLRDAAGLEGLLLAVKKGSLDSNGTSAGSGTAGGSGARFDAAGRARAASLSNGTGGGSGARDVRAGWFAFVVGRGRVESSMGSKTVASEGFRALEGFAAGAGTGGKSGSSGIGISCVDSASSSKSGRSPSKPLTSKPGSVSSVRSSESP